MSGSGWLIEMNEILDTLRERSMGDDNDAEGYRALAKRFEGMIEEYKRWSAEMDRSLEIARKAVNGSLTNDELKLLTEGGKTDD